MLNFWPIPKREITCNFTLHLTRKKAFSPN
uniref:Uncharacterized protein n=1 Tax=Rhizophora mucronata TaxID=61149 RepID=A0A2P2NN68_RHIMU